MGEHRHVGGLIGSYASMETEGQTNDVTSKVAFALFPRIRSVILALDRQDRLDTAHDFVGWLEEIRKDEGRIGEMAEHMVLRALRVAADPTNFRILRRLAEGTSVPLRALMSDLGMGRVPLHDRINELMQVGLAVQELESDDVRATSLTEAIVTLITGITQELTRMVEAWVRNE